MEIRSGLLLKSLKGEELFLMLDPKVCDYLYKDYDRNKLSDNIYLNEYCVLTYDENNNKESKYNIAFYHDDGVEFLIIPLKMNEAEFDKIADDVSILKSCYLNILNEYKKK